MTAPTYRVGETLDVTLPAVKVTSVSGAESGEIEVLLKCPSGGLYRTDIPLNVAAIRRVTPAGGPPRPGEVWADTDGVVRWACRGAAGDVLLRDADNAVAPWQKINVERGPITCVYRPASAAPAAPAGQAETTPEQPAAPRLMLGDVWRGDAGADWRVVEQGGALGLRFSGGGVTWEWGEVDHDCGPLRLVQRAGYRRTANTTPAERLRRGMVVSCEAWEDDAPVTITGSRPTGILSRERGVEVEYRPLGGDRTTVVAVGSAAKFTLWDEDGTCGDCATGRCHGEGPDDCDCDRHNASVEADRV